MKIEVGESAGFCFGVKRAVDIVNKLIGSEAKVYTLGPIIHNDCVVNDLKDKGINVLESVDAIKERDIVVIRSHGVPISTKEEILKKGAVIIDATCPFVQKIHKIVQKNSGDDKIVLIAGDRDHPEVRGIKGHCSGECYVFQNEKELKDIIKKHPYLLKKNITVVAQTTFSVNELRNCVKNIKKVYTKAEIFDTICNETSRRQKEAEKLSKNSDLMIVIGGKNSSNTAKLRDICKKNCETYLIENSCDIPIMALKSARNIAITAGASTPVRIIKEVVKTMEEVINKSQLDQELDDEMDFNFEKMLEESLKNLSTGDRVNGIVISITPNEVYVDVGRKQAGFIPRCELSNDPNVDPLDIVKVGEELDLLIMRTDDQEGTIMLSKKRIEFVKGWDILSKAQDDEKELKGIVREVSKYGLIVRNNSIDIFIPNYQASLSRNTKLEELLGKEVTFKIIEVERKRRRAIGSIRAVLKKERDKLSQEFWEEAKEGKSYKGKVVAVTDYGVFVDIGGIDGMVHISELSWNRVTHPSDILKVEDEIEVSIKSLDKENNKISLTYKKEKDNPWGILKKDYPIGSIIDSEITGITEYGAFAKVIDALDGLIHISEMVDNKIENSEGKLSVGDKVKVKILDIDFDKRRIKLSMKYDSQEEVVGEAPNVQEKVKKPKGSKNSIDEESIEEK